MYHEPVPCVYFFAELLGVEGPKDGDIGLEKLREGLEGLVGLEGRADSSASATLDNLLAWREVVGGGLFNLSGLCAEGEVTRCGGSRLEALVCL